MSARWLAVLALLVPVLLAGQETAVLRVTITLADAAGQATPVARHTLLVSDNPATAGPKTVRTATDGTVSLTLPPGSYAVESARPVLFEGKAYEWFQYLDLKAGETVALALTAANAEMAEPSTAPADSAESPATDPTFLLGQWQRGVVAVWSPTARVSGTLVDARGLIVTDGTAVGDADTVAVQLSPMQKISGSVLRSEDAPDVAVVWVGPAAVERRPVVPIACGAGAVTTVPAGEPLLALTSELNRPTDITWGRVISPGPPRLATDFRMSRSGAGGPVFDEAGTLLGLTAIRLDPDSPRWHEVEVIPSARVCVAVAAARVATRDAPPPMTTTLPVEPSRPFAVSVLETTKVSAGGTAPPTLTSDDFEVAFVTPLAIHLARQKADWTGGASARAPDVEARLGRVTDFGGWSDYFADAPAVVVVRATPKMVEGFWKRVAREAARTQGAALPPFRHFKTTFVGMTLRCGETRIAPVHPFVLDHPTGDAKVIREGLYVFDPAAFDPACADLRLELRSGQGVETIAVPAGIVERIRNDFAPWRDAPR